MPLWISNVAYALLITVASSLAFALMPLPESTAQNVTSQWDVEPLIIEYPVEMNALRVSDSLYISDFLGLEDGGMVLASHSWSINDDVGNAVFMRYAADNTLAWYWASGLAGNRMSLSDPIHLGGERFAVLLGEETGETGYKEEILIIEHGLIIERIILGYAESWLDRIRAIHKNIKKSQQKQTNRHNRQAE